MRFDFFPHVAVALTLVSSACSDDGGVGDTDTASGTAESESDTAETTAESESGSSGSDSDTETDTDIDTTETDTDTTETTTETETTETETGDPDACSGSCGSPGCLPCPGDPMVDGGGFQIMATEVSNASYAQFLAENFDPDFLAGWIPEVCAWKEGDFVPNPWDDEPEMLPVVGVDWCDAWAYCSWAGMRLCGDVDGSAASPDSVDDPINNQWFRACSQLGAKIYPYGVLYDETACNGADAGFGQLTLVGSLADCEGGVDGLFDMSGNVWEWTSSCAEEDVPDEEQECRRRGGSYFSDGPTVRCAIDSLRPRNLRASSLGMRCCEL
ncbi:SUMF1/EgtB/PvdO family nonheme iron enzyme [Pseudenhygromyxa sp. WMMC2535]|uniref:formylglycine-generating enzyme family protein n=1 Tax=Pseudenhygromyxa sp. WMMC2535 TaxID=2712867 RepID=UPI001554D74E|nr:SUMF1/EgtB/PvdO family nonheme iron enzyme [Pseudenhygromyxa sp. WMMC2535]NVB36890.1 SUMF1/EgtB/PvdO family nonheme iron enzyme [Pseudenhygromyxa sp. WMMC2535]